MSKEDFLLVFGFFGTGPIFTALAIFIDNIILKRNVLFLKEE